MKIKDIFSKEFVIEDLKAKNKHDALVELSAAFIRNQENFDHDSVVDVLMARESLGSTGIGDGIAIPHGKHKDLQRLVISFGRSKKGVDFNAMDGKPAHLFFLLMAPEKSTGQHLKVLAKISRMLKDSKFRENLMEAKTADDLCRMIAEREDACSMNGRGYSHSEDYRHETLKIRFSHFKQSGLTTHSCNHQELYM